MKIFITVMVIIASFSVNANEAFGTYDNDAYKPFDASVTRHDTISITWKRVKDSAVTGVCKAEGKKRGFPITVDSAACSFWNGNECIIITGMKTSMHEIGHEYRHCFQGSWH